MTDASIEKNVAVEFEHRLRFTRDAFETSNATLAQCMDGGSRRLAVFVDEGVSRRHPGIVDRIREYAAAHQLELRIPVVPVPGGEQIKNDRRHVEEILERIHDARLCRRSYVLGIGGGAVLDAVGFAAALAHRGIRLVRVPSTTLAQCDSGVGVKNGINAFGKKNYLGVFVPPWAVVNDEALLETLSDRDFRSGQSEAVKVALVRDSDFFERIEAVAPSLAARDRDVTSEIMRRSALLHLLHITEGGDPFEMVEARPLDFGHWTAHKLEHLTNHALKHGEAVAIGIAIDVVYCAQSGLLERGDADRILALLELLGFDLYHEALADPGWMAEALDEFREHLGGRLTLAMLKGIGEAIDIHEVDGDAMIKSMQLLADRAGTAGP